MVYASWICQGKRPFASRIEADTHLRKRQKRKSKLRKGWTGGGTVNAYKCALCGSWHLGYDAKRKPSR